MSSCSAPETSLAARLPPFVTPVLLFVNASPHEVQQACSLLPQALLQFHGDEAPEQCAAAGHPWMRAARMDDGFDLLQLIPLFHAAQALLLDAHVEGYGGGGKAFDSSQFHKACPFRSFCLVG